MGSGDGSKSAYVVPARKEPLILASVGLPKINKQKNPLSAVSMHTSNLKPNPNASLQIKIYIGTQYFST